MLQLPQSTVSRHLKALADAGGSARAPRHQPAVHDGARAARRADPPAVAARPRTGRADRRGARRTTPPAGRARASGGPSRRSSSRRRPGSGIVCATSCSATVSTCRRCSALAGRAWIGRRPRAAAPARSRAALAPFVARVIAVDNSAAMLQAAQRRLHASRTSSSAAAISRRCRIDDAALDAATLMLVLPSLPQPARVAARGRARAEARRPAVCRRHAAARSRAAIASRWATCGSGSPSEQISQRARGRGLRRASDLSPLPPTRAPRGRRCSSPPPAERDRASVRADRSTPQRRRPQAVSRPPPCNVQCRRRCSGSRSWSQRRSSMATVTEKLHPFAAAKAAGREPFKVRDLVARRVRPQGNPPRRAGDARPDGAARAVRRQEAARRRARHGQPAHDHSDGGPDRDARRPRRRRALGVLQHLLDAGSRRGRGRRRPARDRRHGREPEGHAGVRVEGRDARGVLVVHEGSARCGPTAAARR